MKPCNQCGKCCIKYGSGNLSATPLEIERWEQSHSNIFQYVSDGEIWIDPSSGSQFEQCPWLRKEKDSSRYTCEIYFARPDDCKQYPSLLEDMIRDSCEMLEPGDLRNRERAKARLRQIAINNSD